MFCDCDEVVTEFVESFDFLHAYDVELSKLWLFAIDCMQHVIWNWVIIIAINEVCAILFVDVNKQKTACMIFFTAILLQCTIVLFEMCYLQYSVSDWLFLVTLLSGFFIIDCRNRLFAFDYSQEINCCR